MKRLLLSWSSGKDAAWALREIRGRSDVQAVGLFTTVNAQFDRVAMHGLRRELLERQAGACGLPLHVIEIPYPCDKETYERAMGEFCEFALDDGVSQMAFGDLFLEDIRGYRIDKLEGTGIEPVFPIWGRPTELLAREMMEAGVRAIISCVDPGKIDSRWAGKPWDKEFVEALPKGVDPCGENGEFHTVVVDSPVFSYPLEVVVGEIVERDGFVFADIIPAE